MGDQICAECGMVCTPGEFHPYAACLMFKACHDGDTVRANLDFVVGRAALAARQDAPCRWTVDGEGLYSTGCGELHAFTADGPAENSYRWCCYCGKPLVDLAQPVPQAVSQGFGPGEGL